MADTTENTQGKVIANLEDVIDTQAKKIKELEHFKDTSIGLWCIDKNPNDVDIEWIRENAFGLKYDVKVVD